jgi:hypothetical protein
MALYKDPNILQQWDNESFDELHEPGAIVPWSGIYRCQGCGHEVVHTIERPLPPQDHHQHKPAQGAIRWRLIVTDSPIPD